MPKPYPAFNKEPITRASCLGVPPSFSINIFQALFIIYIPSITLSDSYFIVYIFVVILFSCSFHPLYLYSLFLIVLFNFSNFEIYLCFVYLSPIVAQRHYKIHVW